jgi:hypothetical protein
LGANLKPLTSDEWLGLLEGAGLRDIVVRTHKINTQNEARGLLRQYRCGGMLGIPWRMLALYARDPAYRRSVKKVRKEGVTPESLEEYFGYGAVRRQEVEERVGRVR